MATIKIKGQDLYVRFTGWERVAVGRADVTVPLSAVRRVERIDRPLAHTRGGRMGVLVSGLVKVGVWGLGTGRRQLVSVRRNVPAVRVTVDRAVAGYDELLISAPNADELAASCSSGALG